MVLEVGEVLGLGHWVEEGDEIQRAEAGEGKSPLM